MSTNIKSFGAHTTALENKEIKTPAFGIDLGTTNSCISVVQSGRVATPIRLSGGGFTLPSCVMWKGGDKFTVGKEAYKSRFKPSVAYSTKRLIGKGKELELKYGRQTLNTNPVVIASKVLEALVQEASHLYPNIKDVVITVPAYFDNNQVKETIEAGKLAGLNVLQTMREPTAASHAYEIEGVGTREETILVYDLGGGTFDVSILQISVTGEVNPDLSDLYGIESESEEGEEKSVYRVLKVGGDNFLGGDDIDEALLEIVLAKLPGLGVNPDLLNKEDRGKLLLALEKMKKSGPQSYSYPFTTKQHGQAISVSIPVDPIDFTNATRKIYQKTRNIMNEVLSSGNLGDLVDRIVLVGGSTKSEILRSFLRRDFPNAEISCALNPDESVSQGAAIYAKKLKFGDDTVQTFDVLPIGIGVVADDKLKVMIRSGQVVPYSQTEAFATTVDNQKEISIEIRQGNTSVVEKSIPLGELIIKDIPQGKAGEVQISVQLKIDANGLLSCLSRVGDKVVKSEIVNIFKGEATAQVSDKDTALIARWEKLLTKLDESKASLLTSVIEEVKSGSLSVEDAGKQVSQILTVGRIELLTRIEGRDHTFEEGLDA